MSQFSQFVKSLSRLYKYSKVKKEYLDELLADKKLSEEEYAYIISQATEQENQCSITSVGHQVRK